MCKALSLLLASCLASFALAQEKPKPKPIETFVDPKSAGEDFAVQGEYTGSHRDKKMGVQVVAEGDGQFRIKVHGGGLPGDGWDGTNVRIYKGKKQADGSIAWHDEKNADDKGVTIVGDGKLTVKIGEESFEITKVLRKSPTEGAKPPEGAIVLFDGKSLDGWTKPDGKSPAAWTLRTDGVMQVKGGDILSKHKFAGPFSLHVEFMLPFMPRARGQGRSNSGVYLQNRYELQVLDSFGLKGVNNEAGGFYQAHDPKVNMCFPPLQWQTYDIDFTPPKWENGKKVANARATVKHNGVVVQDNVEFTKGPSPGGNKEEDSPQGIRLQDHGNPLMFRNIWAVEKK